MNFLFLTQSDYHETSITKHYLKLSLFFISLFLSFSINGQSTFEQLSEQSTKVIEGKVIQQISFKSAENGYIYTRNIIEVLKVFKGTQDSKIEIISLGGTLNNQEQYWSHSFMLSPNNNGIFFLKESTLFSDTYIPISEYEGFIAFRDYSGTGRNLYGYGFKKIYKNIADDIYQPLTELHGQPTILKLNQHELDLLKTKFRGTNTDCVEYTLTNFQLVQSNSLTNSNSYSLDFDIDIRSLGQTFKLTRTELTMEYPTNLLGKNIVMINSLIGNLGNQFSNYTLSATDVDTNKVQIKVTKTSGQPAKNINSYHQQLFHVSIFIQNFSLSAILSLSVNQNYDLKTFRIL